MNREYHRFYSSALGRDMEFLVFGHGGIPVIVFPTSMGRFFDYENRHMIEVVGDAYRHGRLQAFCVDSVDTESWYNKSVHPADRARRHNQYDRYLTDELLPYVRSRNTTPGLVATGCSFGGYHAINFGLRHPDLVTHGISMGGAFDIHQFVNGYYDDNCYFNCPPDFVSNVSEGPLLDQMRRGQWILATGETDICLEENRRMSRVLASRGIPHYLDVWGNGTGHDWPWWEQMAVKFLGPLHA